MAPFYIRHAVRVELVETELRVYTIHATDCLVLRKTNRDKNTKLDHACSALKQRQNLNLVKFDELNTGAAVVIISLFNEARYR